MRKVPHTRRDFLLGTAVTVTGMTLSDQGRAQPLAPTPSCDDHAGKTLAQTEGPFFKPRSPERSELIEPQTKGRLLTLRGLVLTRGCRPVAGALVDIWHADENGNYDNQGNRYRGHQFTDAEGRYLFRTVVPAVYTGRTRHYHLKVQAPGRSILTTQIYFPNEPENRRDGLFRKELLMRVTETGGSLDGRFDFVLDMA